MGIRVLFLGEIVGKGGVFCIKKLLPELKKERNIDFVIANGEGATGGFGIGKTHAMYIHKLGVDVITSGEKIYFKKDMAAIIQKLSFVLRPVNYPYGNPGRGWWTYTIGDTKLAVVNVLGQSGFQRVHLQSPFLFIEDLIERIKKETNNIIVDFHASTTAEKYSLFHFLNGKVSAVIGTHTKAITADAHIMKGGTAVICDNGRTGSLLSVGGLAPDVEIGKFLTQIPERSSDAWDGLELQGVIIDINNEGKAEAIETLRIPCEGSEDDRESNSIKD